MSLADEYRRQYAWRDWQRIYPPIAAGDVVIDVGCGVGDQSADLAARGAEIMALDGNPELLAAARAKAIAGATFHEVDLVKWHEPGLGAAGMWCSFVAAYFMDFGAVLARWVEALRPGAWVMLIEIDDLLGHEPFSSASRERLDRFYDDAFDGRRYDFRMGRKLATHARAAGLEIVREEVLTDRELSFDGAADAEVMEAWTRRLNRMKGLENFLGADFASFRDELLSALSSPAHRSRARVVAVEARVR